MSWVYRGIRLAQRKKNRSGCCGHLLTTSGTDFIIIAMTSFV